MQINPKRKIKSIHCKNLMEDGRTDYFIQCEMTLWFEALKFFLLINYINHVTTVLSLFIKFETHVLFSLFLNLLLFHANVSFE